MNTDIRRQGVATFRGRPVTLLGPQLSPGDTTPDFTVLATDMSPITLASTAGMVRILTSVPSLDTGVCDEQTRRFDKEATRLDGVSVLTVSVDLPFAQSRWCGAAGIDRVRTGSDHRDLSFGLAYGVAVEELRLLSRAVFVVNSRDVLVHVEYVPEIGQLPDYEAVLTAVAEAR